MTDGQNPLANATIGLRLFGETPYREETLHTDSAGATNFELAAPLDPKKVVGQVTVHAQSFALQGQAIKSSTLDFALQPGVVWRGKIADEAGAPIAGALVNVRAFQEKGGFLSPDGDEIKADYSVRSSADGTFSIADVPPGSSVSYGIAAHYFAAGQGLGVSVAAPVNAVLQPGGALSGQITGLDGKPLADIHVIAQNSDDRYSGGGGATSGANGKFVIDSLAPGNYVVWASLDSEELYRFPILKNLTAQAGQTRQIPMMRAVEGRLINGIVRDKDTKKPLEGAQVNGIFGPRANGPFVGSSEITKADGRFSLRVLPGQTTFYLPRTPKFYLYNGSRDAQTIDINDKTPELVFDLQSAPALTGTIVDEKNQPIKAQLRSWGDSIINSDADGKWSWTASALQPLTFGGGEDETGYFEVLSKRSLDVPQTAPNIVKVRKLPWRSLSGRVVAPDGKTRAGVAVTAEFFFNLSEDGGLGQTLREATTDAQGRYRFDKIRADENGEMLNSLKVTAKSDADDLSFVEGGEITPDGKNYRASDIVLVALDRQISGTTSPGARVVAAGKATRADAQGKFVFADLPAGQVAVYAALDGRFGSAVAADDAPVNIELAPMKAQNTDAELGRDVWREVINETQNGEEFYARDWVLGQLNAVEGDTFAALQAAAMEPPTDAHDWSLAAQLEKWAPKLDAPTRIEQIESVARGIGDPDIRATAWLEAAIAIGDDDKVNARALREAAAALDHTPVQMRWREANLYRLAIVTERAQGEAAGAAALDQAMELTLKSYGPTTFIKDGYQTASRYAMLSGTAGLVAQGSPALLQRLMVNIPADVGDNVRAMSGAIPVVARTRGVEAALPLLEELHAIPKPDFAPGDSHASNNEPQYAFDVAARRVVPLLAATSPARALELARRISDKDGRARALASVAAFETPEIAAQLWREAVTTGDVGDAPRFAAQAFDSDAKLGVELFALARTRGASADVYRRGGFWAPYAFYLARADAASARLELEREWSANLASNEGQNLSPIAMAMSAADGSRALEMARQIPKGKDNFWSLEVRRKIGQYLMADKAERRDWPFDRWGATDTWSPSDEEW